MQDNLVARLCKTFDDKPVAVLANLPDDGTELRPDQLRALASALMQTAADSEALDITGKHFQPQERNYGLDSLSAAERGVLRSPDGQADIEIESCVRNGHKITIFQDANLTDGRPSFFAMVGTVVSQENSAFSIQEAREQGNRRGGRAPLGT